MKMNLFFWQLVGFIFTGIGGVLLHFAYDWSGESPVIAAFSGVNESTFEHMKLLFFPMFIFAIIESRFVKKSNFWCVKLRGLTLGISLIPIIFYTLRGVFGTTPDWINVTIYFISAAVAFIYEYRLFKKEKGGFLSVRAAFIILLIIAVLFAVFTWFPPELPLFRDPLTLLYGI